MLCGLNKMLKKQFKKAYEEGNADEMTKAQELLSKATLAEQQSTNMAASLQQQIAQNLPQPEIQQLHNLILICKYGHKKILGLWVVSLYTKK